MPELADEQRHSINERIAIRAAYRKSFEGRHYYSTSCVWCSWTSNGLSPRESEENNRVHIREAHPESFDLPDVDIRELRDSLHDHTCQLERCVCVCGCTDGPFCVLVFGPLCSTCAVRDMRGDKDHGEPTA